MFPFCSLLAYSSSPFLLAKIIRLASGFVSFIFLLLVLSFQLRGWLASTDRFHGATVWTLYRGATLSNPVPKNGTASPGGILPPESSGIRFRKAFIHSNFFRTPQIFRCQGYRIAWTLAPQSHGMNPNFVPGGFCDLVFRDQDFEPNSCPNLNASSVVGTPSLAGPKAGWQHRKSRSTRSLVSLS